MPLHPLVVHFPIALLLTATVIEIVNLFLKKENVSRMGTVLVVVGVVSGFASILTGEGAEEFAVRTWGKGIEETAELHESLSTVSIILFAIVAAIKLFGKRFKLTQTLVTAFVILLGLSGSTTLAITGHLGGKMVYENEQITNTTNSTVEDED